MGTSGSSPAPLQNGLTERQRQWMESVRTGLQRDTGRSLEEWVQIARTCPETRPRARARWMKETHGLGANRAAVVLGAAFPSSEGWGQPDALRKLLWSEPAQLRILEAVEARAGALEGCVTGQRKGFTGFSRSFQFAAARPLKSGAVVLGLAVAPDADPRLEPPRNEGWSERLTSKVVLTDPEQVDDSLTALMKLAWERS